MTKEEFEKILTANPGLAREFEVDRRVWISHLPSVQLSSFTDRLSAHLGCTLACTQMEPELEFVFFDPSAIGNSENELLEVARKRAGEVFSTSA